MTELDSLSSQPQFTSRTSLVSQRYQQRSLIGKAFYRVRRALFARNGSFLLLLIVIILTISTLDWALWKISLNRFHAKHSNTTYTFFVLQLYSLMMLSLSFTAMMISMHILKTIDKKQRQFPQSKFVKMSIFDAACTLCSSMSSASVAGHLQTLLSQGALPLIMITSIIMLQTRYTAYQVFGAACILTGTLVAAIPGVNSKDMSGRSTKLWAVLLYVTSLVPLAIGNTYREYIFRDSAPTSAPPEITTTKCKGNSNSNFCTDSRYDGNKNNQDNNNNNNNQNGSDQSYLSTSSDTANENTPLGSKTNNTYANNKRYDTDDENDQNNDDGIKFDKNGKEILPQLNIFYLMFWTSLYQFLFSLLAFPILTLDIFGGVAWKDMPLQFTNGFKCFAGHYVPELECEVGIQPGVILSVYVLFNFGLCIMRLLLIKHGSALLLQITNALALLLSNIIFSWKFIMGQYTEKYNKYDFIGLIFVLGGFILFQVGIYYKDLDAQRQKLFEQAKKQEEDLALAREGKTIYIHNKDDNDGNYINTEEERIVVTIPSNSDDYNDNYNNNNTTKKIKKTQKNVRYKNDTINYNDSDDDDVDYQSDRVLPPAQRSLDFE